MQKLIWNILGLAGIEPGTTNSKSAILTPRPRIFEKCLEKPKIYRPDFLKSRFYAFFDNELLIRIHQQFKDFPKVILITFSAKKPIHIEMVIKDVMGCVVITHP